MKLWKGTGIALTLTWIMIRGPSLSAIPGEVLNGMIIGFGTALIFRKMLGGSFSFRRGLTKIVPLLKYSAVFLKELVVANLDVAKRVLHPEVPIHPKVIDYNLEVQNPLAITILANSITLTPGTLTLGHDRNRNELRIHSINGAEEEEDIKDTVRTWEKLLEKVFNGDKR